YHSLTDNDKHGYRNINIGSIKIVDANIQIEDGFIIGITFHIDPSSALKYSLKVDQAFRGRYNLRNIMYAGYDLNNGYPIYFQKEKSSFSPENNFDFL
ncbi:MAG: hypothetical protein ABI203_09695, partial [Mucilaginibacter sp.]